MKNKTQKIFVLLIFVLLLSSCATVDYDSLLNTPDSSWSKNDQLSFYEDNLQNMKDDLFKETKDKTTGIKILLDKRPLRDKFFTRRLNNFPEMATRKLIENFSDMFKAIHYPPEFNEDIIIEGKINRFFGDAHPAFIFSPFDIYIYGVTTITLEIKDNKTGKTITKLKESSVDWGGGAWVFRKRNITGYINDAFSKTMGQLKAHCLWELKKYYSNKQM